MAEPEEVEMTYKTLREKEVRVSFPKKTFAACVTFVLITLIILTSLNNGMADNNNIHLEESKVIDWQDVWDAFTKATLSTCLGCLLGELATIYL